MMNPGEGYLVKMSAPDELIFPESGARRMGSRLNPSTPARRSTSDTVHFQSVAGNPADPTWTIYLASATIDGIDMEPEDEIAIFDGGTLVGACKLTGILTDADKFGNFITAWSTLTESPGYTPGGGYTFKCWDASAQLEFTGSAAFSDPAGDAYTKDGFPSEDGRYSIAELAFSSEIAKGDIDGSGSVDLGDAIAGLKVLAGISQTQVDIEAALTNKITIKDVIYILQVSAELNDY